MKTEEKTIETKETEIETPIAQAVPVAHVETTSNWVPTKTFFLILLLVLIAGCLLALAIIPNLKLNSKPAKTVAKIDYAQTKLSLSTPTALTTGGYETDVQISTGKNKATVVQLELNYDPKILGNVDIKSASFFTNPIVLLKKVDEVNGRITFVLGINPGDTPSTGIGTVATISFSSISKTATVSSPINFLPKTAVNAVGYAQSVLLESTGVLFSVSPIPAMAK